MTLIKDILKQYKMRKQMDDYAINEFNKICNFGLKLLIVLMVWIALVYTIFPSVEKHYSICMGITGVIGIVSFINVIRMSRKGLLVFNHNMDLLVPALLFLPFIILRTLEITLYYGFNVEFSQMIVNVLCVIVFIAIYLIINEIYKSSIKKLYADYDAMEKDLREEMKMGKGNII